MGSWGGGEEKEVVGGGFSVAPHPSPMTGQTGSWESERRVTANVEHELLLFVFRRSCFVSFEQSQSDISFQIFFE